MAVRILIADDDAAIRRLLRRLIENHADWSVCGDAQDGKDAIGKAEELSPDVIVLDLAMPQMNGFQAARAITRATCTSIWGGFTNTNRFDRSARWIQRVLPRTGFAVVCSPVPGTKR